MESCATAKLRRKLIPCEERGEGGVEKECRRHTMKRTWLVEYVMKVIKYPSLRLSQPGHATGGELGQTRARHEDRCRSIASTPTSFVRLDQTPEYLLPDKALSILFLGRSTSGASPRTPLVTRFPPSTSSLNLQIPSSSSSQLLMSSGIHFSS